MTFSKLQADSDSVNVANSDLEFGYGDLFSSECREGFADLESNISGIRIVMDKAHYEGEILYCQLLVTFGFKRTFIAGFNRIREAIVVLMEYPALRQSASFCLSDPHKILVEYEGDNRVEHTGVSVNGSKTAHSEITLEIPVTAYSSDSQIYFRAVLEEHCSNVVEVTLSDGVTTDSYLKGMPYTPITIDLDDNNEQ